MTAGTKKKGKNCTWVGNNAAAGTLTFIPGEGRRVDVLAG